MSDEVQIVVKIDRQVRNDLKKKAIDEDINMKELVERIFREYLYK